MPQIRHRNVRSAFAERKLSYQYIDAHGIMRRCAVSRATAYRYLRAISTEQKLIIYRLQGKPRIAALIPAVDRMHARMVRGNPACRHDPLHQRAAAAGRWRDHEKP